MRTGNELLGRWALVLGGVLAAVAALSASGGARAAPSGALEGFLLAAIDTQDGTGGVDPFVSCADDGICNIAACKNGEDPDCSPENCNADGRCVPSCESDPDCKEPRVPPAHDERVKVQDPTRVPFRAIAKVDIGPDGGGRGTAALIGPCTFLTNGHVVYDRERMNFRAIQKVHPGSYYDENKDKAIDPYGSREPSLLATNTSWEATGEAVYDYGAIFIDKPFDDIEPTLIPVVFEYEPGFVNVSGYPSKGLPSDAAGAKQEQWHGWGAVTRIEDRLLRYDARSTGGASGSPVWEFEGDTGERRLVAVNRAHDGATGIGTRMVSANEDVVTRWMRRGCALADDPGARSRKARKPGLLRTRQTARGEPIPLLTPQQLGLVAPPADGAAARKVRRVAQWIDGQLYRWEERLVAGGKPRETSDGGAVRGGAPARAPGQRHLVLLEPERRALSTEEAAVLLSASRLWLREAKPSPTRLVAYDAPAAPAPVTPGTAPRRPGVPGPEREITGAAR